MRSLNAPNGFARAEGHERNVGVRRPDAGTTTSSTGSDGVDRLADGDRARPQPGPLDVVEGRFEPPDDPRSAHHARQRHAHRPDVGDVDADADRAAPRARRSAMLRMIRTVASPIARFVAPLPSMIV